MRSDSTAVDTELPTRRIESSGTRLIVMAYNITMYLVSLSCMYTLKWF